MNLDERRRRLSLQIRDLLASEDPAIKRHLTTLLGAAKAYQRLKGAGYGVKFVNGLIRIEPSPVKHLYPGRSPATIESHEKDFNRQARLMSEITQRLKTLDEDEKREQMVQAEIAKLSRIAGLLNKGDKKTSRKETRRTRHLD